MARTRPGKKGPFFSYAGQGTWGARATVCGERVKVMQRVCGCVFCVSVVGEKRAPRTDVQEI